MKKMLFDLALADRLQYSLSRGGRASGGHSRSVWRCRLLWFGGGLFAAAETARKPERDHKANDDDSSHDRSTDRVT